jgi:type II secretory pathway pseudopilin PulG
MQILAAMSNEGRAGSPLPAARLHDAGAHGVTRPTSAFTMIEIAISLAIIGIALVGIIGVLPQGLNTQRANREQTVINQDATVFIEAVRNGVRGADDLTNYVYAVVNTGSSPAGYINPQLAGEMNFSESTFSVPANKWSSILTSGSNIVGLLSTPVFINGTSNHIIACVRSISGPAVEKPPQDNPLLQQDSFSYRIYCVNAPVAQDANTLGTPYGTQLNSNLHELRLTFLWPVLPNGNLPARPLQATFRTLVAGQVAQDSGDTNLYFYQPQSFTTAP